MKTLLTLILILAVVTPATAERICPHGKSYKMDECKEVTRRKDGTVDIYPVGKSYKRDECWVMR